MAAASLPRVQSFHVHTCLCLCSPLQDPHMPVDMQRVAAKSLNKLAESCGAADRTPVDDLMPKEPMVRPWRPGASTRGLSH